MRLYTSAILIAAFTASISHAGWNGGYGGGSVSGALTGITSITGSGGAVLDLSGATPTITTNLQFADSTGVTWASGASIKDDGSDNLVVQAGAAAGSDVAIKEGSTDGGDTRLIVNGAGTIQTFTAAGGLDIVAGTSGQTTLYNSINVVGKARADYIELDAQTSVTTPADGRVVIWAPLDAATVTDNVVQALDQAGTSADITHGAIDIEAP